MNDKTIPEEILKKYPHFNDFLKKKDKYILDENRNVIPATLMEWGQYLEDHRSDRIVKQEKIGDLSISTVFIGLDHNLSLIWEEDAEKKESYKPHIFETMIFKDGSDIYCTRYSTWKEAEEGHAIALTWITDGCKEEEDNDD